MLFRAAARRVRAPAETRRRILEAAFEEIYRHGFQAASIDAILEGAGVTKGALYHHFADKAALGYAVVDELIRQPVLDAYAGRLEAEPGDSLTALQAVLRRRAEDFRAIGVTHGCPLNNLAQEMSPLDEGFRRRVASALEAWTDAFARALERGQASGAVRRDVDARRIAAFLVASIEGAFGMAKNAKSVASLRSHLEVLADFLEALRPPTQGAAPTKHRRLEPRTQNSELRTQNSELRTQNPDSPCAFRSFSSPRSLHAPPRRRPTPRSRDGSVRPATFGSSATTGGFPTFTDAPTPTPSSG